MRQQLCAPAWGGARPARPGLQGVCVLLRDDLRFADAWVHVAWQLTLAAGCRGRVFDVQVVQVSCSFDGLVL